MLSVNSVLGARHRAVTKPDPFSDLMDLAIYSYHHISYWESSKASFKWKDGIHEPNNPLEKNNSCYLHFKLVSHSLCLRQQIKKGQVIDFDLRFLLFICVRTVMLFNLCFLCLMDMSVLINAMQQSIIHQSLPIIG